MSWVCAICHVRNPICNSRCIDSLRKHRTSACPKVPCSCEVVYAVSRLATRHRSHDNAALPQYLLCPDNRHGYRIRKQDCRQRNMECQKTTSHIDHRGKSVHQAPDYCCVSLFEVACSELSATYFPVTAFLFVGFIQLHLRLILDMSLKKLHDHPHGDQHCF